MAAVLSEVALVEVEDRPYQAHIAQACLGRNSLIVLPTGLGKTLICARVMAHHLDHGERVLVLAPTRPLVEQHAETFRTHLTGVEVGVVTGQTRPEDRQASWAAFDVVVATPQVVRNDLLRDALDPRAWDLLVVDEAHRAVGNYAAVTVADALRQASTRVLAATASPGGDGDALKEVCTNLGIQHIEARGPWDEDVAPYVQRVRRDWVRVTLPNTLDQAASCLRRVAEQETSELRSMGLYASRFTSRRELLKVQRTLGKRLDGDAAKRAGRAHAHASRALKALHAAQLVQTQSVAAAASYLERLTADDQVLSAHRGIRDARRLLDQYLGEHPKMRRCALELRQYLKETPDGRALVFTQFRETATRLVEALEAVDSIDPALFVGQGGEGGLTQQEQVERLAAFREGSPNVLVATSVGEEGLDVPSVGLVVFYDPVASPVRAIQRRGRTGRSEEGRVVLLMARGTSDEAVYWRANEREKRMRRLIRGLQRADEPTPTPTIRPNPVPEPTAADGNAVLVDHRELNGPLARLLRQRGVRLDPQTLPVADVIVSSRVAVERKSARDFVRSLVDGRLMDQARALKRSFEAPVLLVEGDPFQDRGNVSRASIAGAVSALSARFGVTLLTVRDVQQAADVVAAMVEQEHKDEDAGPPKLRHGSAGHTHQEQQRYLLEGLPHISSTLAQRLLDHFASPGAALAADQEALKRVHGIGPATARAIHEVLHLASESPCEPSSDTTVPAPTTASGTGSAR